VGKKPALKRELKGLETGVGVLTSGGSNEVQGVEYE
jgi:hypothetical protein